MAIELYSKELISNEVKNEAIRVAGDPEQKAIIIVKELISLSCTFKPKLLTIARALSELPSVNSIGGMIEALFWRIVTFGMYYNLAFVPCNCTLTFAPQVMTKNYKMKWD